MTAPPPPLASTTAQMLSEIGIGAAAELLMGVRYNTCPPGPTFISHLDELLLEARPHEGGSSLRRGDLIELVGPSGSGKTVLATFLLLTTLLPPSIPIPLDYPYHTTPTLTVPLGGRGMRAAVLSPPTHRSIIPLLRRGMVAHIESCVAAAIAGKVKHYDVRVPVVQAAIAVAVEAALGKLVVLRPQAKAMAWTAALHRVLALREGVDLVVCDGFADGFWPERWAEEERGERKRIPDLRGSEDAGLRDVWDVVTALRRDAGAVVVLTVQGLRPIPDTPFYRPHLPSPYPSPFAQRHSAPEPPSSWPLNIQLTLLGRSRKLQLPAETMLVPALHSRPPPPDVQDFEAVMRVPGGKGEAGFSGGMRWAFGVGENGFVSFTLQNSS